MFLHRPRRVLDRSFILEDVWGYDFPTTANSLEVYVGYLRRKTEAEGEPRLIHTVRGVGTSSKSHERPQPLGRFRYRRSLASRVILLTTFAVGLSVAIVALAAYLTVRHQLQSTLDESLHRRAYRGRRATSLDQLTVHRHPGVDARRRRHQVGYIAADGAPRRPRDPASDRSRSARPELAVAQGSEHYSCRTLTAGGGDYRVAAVPRHRRLALVVAQSLESNEHTLDKLGLVMFLFGARRRDRRGARRLGGGPQRPAPRAPADRRRRGHRPHRAARPDRGRGQRRDRPAGPRVQRDARRAVRLARPAAPAGRRRRPRAAHPADLAAHQPRPAHPGGPAGRALRRSRGPSCSTTYGSRSRSSPR